MSTKATSGPTSSSPSDEDSSVFSSVKELVNDVHLHGYYGGIRLLKATIKKFHDYCQDNDIELHNKNFTIRYESDIPHGVGLAGSSAIITACLRAIMTFYGVSIPKYTQANLILSCELDELQIAAGLQDRVIQAYEGLVYMDFDKSAFAKRGYGIYEQLDVKLLPPLYIAYREDLSEISGKVHNTTRERFDRGEPLVLSAMKYWARLTDKVKFCLLKGEKEKISTLLNLNFDRRKKIYPISAKNLQLVEEARSVGVSAKFTGSGGAIVGIYNDEKMFSTLKKRLRKIKVKTIKPQIAIAKGRA